MEELFFAVVAPEDKTNTLILWIDECQVYIIFLQYSIYMKKISTCGASNHFPLFSEMIVNIMRKKRKIMFFLKSFFSTNNLHLYTCILTLFFIYEYVQSRRKLFIGVPGVYLVWHNAMDWYFLTNFNLAKLT